MSEATKSARFLKFDKIQVFNFFFFGILLFLVYQLLKILSPFFGALLIAVTLALIFYPVHIWVRSRITARRNLSAFLSTISVSVTVILPLLVFGWLLFKESKEIYPRTNIWLSNLTESGLDLKLPEQFRSIWNLDAEDVILNNLKNVQESIMKSGGTILKNIFFAFASLLVIIAALFIFFRDGENILHWMLDTIPMDSEHKYRIANQLSTTIIAVARGFLLTAAVQGASASIGYAIAGVPAPILFGMLTAFAALIPFVGTSLVWLPLSLAAMYIKGFPTGLFLLIWGATVVGLLDNILRPILIGQKARLPIFILFLGIFGGIRVYGPIGILLGPILISCLLVFLQIYREARNTEQKPE